MTKGGGGMTTTRKKLWMFHTKEKHKKHTPITTLNHHHHHHHTGSSKRRTWNIMMNGLFSSSSSSSSSQGNQPMLLSTSHTTTTNNNNYIKNVIATTAFSISNVVPFNEDSSTMKNGSIFLLFFFFLILFIPLLYLRKNKRKIQQQQSFLQYDVIPTPQRTSNRTTNHYHNNDRKNKKKNPSSHGTTDDTYYYYYYNLPYLGQILNFLMYRPWDLLMSWHIQYGPILQFILLHETMISISNHRMLVKMILQKSNTIQKDITNTMKPFLCLLGTGIVSSEGKKWMEQRKKMSHPLRTDILTIIPKHTIRALQNFVNEIEQQVEQQKQTQQQNEQQQTNENKKDDNEDTYYEIPLGQKLRYLTLQVISSSFLSLSGVESNTTFAQYYLPIVDECNARVWHPYRSYCFFLPSFYIFHYHVYQLNQYVSTLIKNRYEQRRREEKQQQYHHTTTTTTTAAPKREQDILDHLLFDIETKIIESKKENKNQNHHPEDTTNTTTESNDDHDHHQQKSKDHESYLLPSVLPYYMIQQIRDEIKTFMLAGHETSAAMMTWTFYELILLQEEEKMRKQQQQLQQQTSSGRSSSETNATNVDHLLKYLDDEVNLVFPSSKFDFVQMDTKTPTMTTTTTTTTINNVIPTNEELSQLMIAESCLKESLRKHSVVPIVARRAAEDIIVTITDEHDEMIPHSTKIDHTNTPNQEKHSNNHLNGDYNSTNISGTSSSTQPASSSSKPIISRTYCIPKGASILINIQACHYNTKYWPDPYKYDPTRFVDIPNRMMKPILDYTFLPFIAGPRNCLGQYLALLESKMVISLLWQKYHFEFVHPEQWGIVNEEQHQGKTKKSALPFDPRHRYMVPVIPKEEIYVRLTKRRHKK